MAVLRISSSAPDYQWWPDLLDISASQITVVTMSTTSIVWRWTTDAGLVEIRMTGLGLAYGSGTFPTGGRPIDGTVSGISLRVDGVEWLSISSLGLQAADIDHVWLGWQRNDRYFDGDPFNLFTFLLSGNDQIFGSDNDDDLFAGNNPGNDSLFGGGGSDYMKADMGNDLVDGGSGWDTYSLIETFYDPYAKRGAVVNLKTGTATDSWGGTDQLTSIEEVVGSRFHDQITASDRDGGLFTGLKGRDTITGGTGFDEVAYWDDVDFGGRRGIVADLDTGVILDGWGQRDRVSGIESVIGTRFADTFRGSAGDDQFLGGAGVDTYDGRGGRDTVNFSWEPALRGAVVDLRLSTRQVLDDGFGNVETLVRIETLDGNELADRFTGNTAANQLVGDRGNDTLNGGGGNDTLQGDQGADLLTGGGGADTFVFTRREGYDPWGDRITDFQSGVDSLAFETRDFDGMDGTLRFQNGTGPGVAGASCFYFNGATGQLFWDADGLGGQAAVLVATLTGVTSLSASDFNLLA